MDRPTDKQIKEFWEWCGWKPYLDENYYDQPPRTLRGWIRDGSPPEPYLPPVDLNNLFKYAVPKLILKVAYIKARKILLDTLEGVFARAGLLKEVDNLDKRTALALFWAIWDIIEES